MYYEVAFGGHIYKGISNSIFQSQIRVKYTSDYAIGIRYEDQKLI